MTSPPAPLDLDKASATGSAPSGAHLLLHHERQTTTENELVLAYGDIASAYRILDRVGMSVETVQHVLNEGKPTGQRGAYGYFRVGAKVIVPGAVRVLKVKA